MKGRREAQKLENEGENGKKNINKKPKSGKRFGREKIVRELHL